MYAKCGVVSNACVVFDNMPNRDLFTWTTMIIGYAQHGCGDRSFCLFVEMQNHGLAPDNVTYVSVLAACAGAGVLEWGKRVHAHLLKRQVDLNIYVGNALMDMYSKCGMLEDACRVFDRMKRLDIVSWNAIISAYSQHGDVPEVINLFGQMLDEQCIADQFTYVSILNSCANGRDLELGKCIHGHFLVAGLEPNIFMENTLLSMYVKCGNLENSHQVFKRMPRCDTISWTLMISGYSQEGDCNNALVLFMQMKSSGLRADSVAYSNILGACATTGALELGKRVHAHLIGTELLSDIFIGNSLIGMYTKCANIQKASQVFETMPAHDVVSWSSIIMGYVEHGNGSTALTLFMEMQHVCKPNKVTYMAVLSACSLLGALEVGKRVHVQILKDGLETDALVNSMLIDMYCKCGCIERAQNVFWRVPTPDMVSWTAIISAYALHGNGNKTIKLLKQMQQYGYSPDSITFISVLTACTYDGLVDEGLHYFDSMTHLYRLRPMDDHYVCLVDLLVRPGHMHEAKDLIDSIPFPPGVVVWLAFLSACRVYFHVELAECAVTEILTLDSQNGAAFVLLSNLYAEAIRKNGGVLSRKKPPLAYVYL